MTNGRGRETVRHQGGTWRDVFIVLNACLNPRFETTRRRSEVSVGTMNETIVDGEALY